MPDKNQRVPQNSFTEGSLPSFWGASAVMAQNERFSVLKGGAPGQCLLIGPKMNPTKVWAKYVQSQPNVQQMVLGQLDTHVQKREPRPLPHTVYSLKTNKKKKLLKVNPKPFDS